MYKCKSNCKSKHKYKSTRCEVCLKKHQETSCFSSSVTSETYKINHHLECNEICLVYLLTCKKCLKRYVGQTIYTFWHCWNNYKSNDRKFQRSEPCMQEHLVRHFSIPGHNGFLSDVSVTFIDKTDPSDPRKHENFWREALMTMTHYGINIEDSIWVFPFDNIEVGTFYSVYICTLWIIGTACFSGLELWKMNLFSHYFINFSFTFLFIVTSFITMVTLLLLLLLLSLMLSI